MDLYFAVVMDEHEYMQITVYKFDGVDVEIIAGTDLAGTDDD